MRYITSIKLFLKKNCLYWKNVYRVFLIKYLSLNLLKIKPSNMKVLKLKKELLKVLIFMGNNKAPVNDGITIEFYIKFWDIVKEPLCASIQ